MKLVPSLKRRRRGITLLEVLLSIGVISIGIFGVMALVTAGQSLTASIRTQSQALLVAAQVTPLLKAWRRTDALESHLQSRCTGMELATWTWRHDDSRPWVSFDAATNLSTQAVRKNDLYQNSLDTKLIWYYTLDSVLADPDLAPAPAMDPVAIDPCGLFTEPGQTYWHPSSIYLCNTMGVPNLPADVPSVRCLRIGLAATNTFSAGRPPTLSLAGAQSAYAGIDDVDYAPPTQPGGPPVNAFESGRRRNSNDYTFALFMILGGRERVPNGPKYDAYLGYREVIGVFRKRNSKQYFNTADIDDNNKYRGPSGCIFSGRFLSGGLLLSLLPAAAGQAQNCVPSFPNYNDGTPETVTRHSGYLKPGKLLLVRFPDSRSPLPPSPFQNNGDVKRSDQWSFQRVVSCQRRGYRADEDLATRDTDSNPQWLIIMTPAIPNSPDVAAIKTNEFINEPQQFLAIAFDDLVLVHDRYDW